MAAAGRAAAAGSAAGTARATDGRCDGMIYEQLYIGERNARSAKELAEILGIDRRGISALVERERRGGKPICATCDSKTPGYYIPATREEMERFCRSLRHRAGEIFKTRAALLKMLDSLPAEE